MLRYIFALMLLGLFSGCGPSDDRSGPNQRLADSLACNLVFQTAWDFIQPDSQMAKTVKRYGAGIALGNARTYCLGQLSGLPAKWSPDRLSLTIREGGEWELWLFREFPYSISAHQVAQGHKIGTSLATLSGVGGGFTSYGDKRPSWLEDAGMKINDELGRL